MPITQDRLLNLIQCAEEYRRKYINLRKAILTEAQLISTKSKSYQDAFRQLIIELEFYSEENEIALLTEERTRWNLTHRKNLTAKEREELKRRAHGVPIRAKTPSSSTNYQKPHRPPPVHRRSDQEIAEEVDSLDQSGADWGTGARQSFTPSDFPDINPEEEDAKYEWTILQIAQANKKLNANYTFNDYRSGKFKPRPMPKNWRPGDPDPADGVALLPQQDTTK